jgi:fibronectin type 3 domain-containing protein
MKKRKIGLAVGILCLLLVSVAVYEILVMVGVFENKDAITGAKPISAIPTSTKQTSAESIPDEQPQEKQAREDDNVGTERIILAWDIVPGATSYVVYWSDTKGVTRRTGNKISAVKNSATITGLKRGVAYYFVVTAVNEAGESAESQELVYLVE